MVNLMKPMKRLAGALSFEISLWLLMGFECQWVFHVVIDNWGFSYILMRIEDFENTVTFESN